MEGKEIRREGRRGRKREGGTVRDHLMKHSHMQSGKQADRQSAKHAGRQEQRQRRRIACIAALTLTLKPDSV